jgi:hypothetical protein
MNLRIQILLLEGGGFPELIRKFGPPKITRSIIIVSRIPTGGIETPPI